MTVAHGNRGFCNINNEAIMVEYLRQKYGLKRIAIVDTDVHHGDGTQEIFYHDPEVLFISFHQDGRTLYPGSGFMEEAGGPLAYGTTINRPVLPRTTDTGIHYVLDHLVMPILEEFKPDIIINSAGQDNHYSDPLANMAFSAQGYARLNETLAPDIAVLEGGYSVESALPYINMGIIMAMAGIDYSNLREPDYKPGRLKEPASNMERIYKIVDTQLNTFRRREEVIEKNRRSGQMFKTSHESIFYDTDYISESQRNELRLCPSCGGFRIINSSARHPNGREYNIACIQLPIYACPGCQEQARDAYTTMNQVISMTWFTCRTGLKMNIEALIPAAGRKGFFSMTIKLLEDDLINKIAAGEVVERPASIVKELVENSIDAKANDIRVKISGGGRERIEVEDNGQGIKYEEVNLAFLRHATSKIRQEADLQRILSLGFRGEALPSIASVSRVDLYSQSAGEKGVHVSLEGGQVLQQEIYPSAPGTRIVVKDLFFNTPARQKFLKSPVTESNYIYELMCKYALSRPDISFSYSSERKNYFKTPGQDSLLDTIMSIYGKDFTDQLMEVYYKGQDYLIKGFISQPEMKRSNRKTS